MLIESVGCCCLVSLLLLQVLAVLSATDFLPVLACRDRHIRILGNDGKPMYEIATASVPTCVRYIPDSHDMQHKFPSAKEVLYGTEDGHVVQLLVDSTAVRQGFTIPSGGGMGAVRSIHCGADYSKVRPRDDFTC